MRKHTPGKMLLAVTGLAFLCVAFSGCGAAEDPWKGVSGGPTRVLASFPPLYCFTKNVAGEHAAVLSLCTNVGPHEFEPSARDNFKIRGANLLLVNGLGLDNFVDPLIAASRNANLKVVKVGDAIPEDRLLAVAQDDDDHGGGHHHDHGDSHHHDHGLYDPHVWLGLPEAMVMVKRIRDGLAEVDPAHKADFARNADDYVRKLAELQAHGKNVLAGKKNRKIVAMHDSLRYFARTFDLEIVGNLQPQPGIEADSIKLKKLVDACKKQGVRVIAVEPQYPQTAAETLRRALRDQKIDIVVVDPLETAAEPIADSYYLEVMRQNIDNLAEKLP